jgi:hypothetical protein
VIQLANIEHTLSISYGKTTRMSPISQNPALKSKQTEQ